MIAFYSLPLLYLFRSCDKPFLTPFSPYDICETIVNMGDSICPSFPEGQPCGCPLLAGDFDLKNVELAVPDFGPILGPLMAVSILSST